MINGTQTNRAATVSATQTIARLVQAWNDHDLAALIALHSADFHGDDSAAAGELRGRPALEAHYRRFLVAFPDLTLTPTATCAAGDCVTLVWRANATHAGEFLHIPPTLRRVTFAGISVFTLADGAIIHSTTVWDVAAWLRAVGLLPKLQK